MSHVLLPLIDCPALQDSLNNVAACKLMPNEPRPFIEFLNSPENTNGVLETRIAPGGGKKRQVQMVYTPRVQEAEVSDTLSTDCEVSDQAGMNSTNYEIDILNGAEYGEQIEFENIASICEANENFIAQRAQAIIDGLTRKIETKLTNQAAALYGKFVADDDTLGTLSAANTLKTIRTIGSDSKYTEDAIQAIVNSAYNSGFCNIPFVFGGGLIRDYMQKSKAVCCANSGIDFAQFVAQNQAMFMYTWRVKDALGLPNGFLAVDLGSLYMLKFNKFAPGSGNTINNDFVQQGIIVDPKTGLPLNYKTYLNPCGEKLSMIFSLAFKVVGLPDDMYSGGDRYEGTNGVLRFNVSNA